MTSFKNEKYVIFSYTVVYNEGEGTASEIHQICFNICSEGIFDACFVCFFNAVTSLWTPDAATNKQACPFCRRTYHPGAAFRDHIKYCQVKDGGATLPFGWLQCHPKGTNGAAPGTSQPNAG